MLRIAWQTLRARRATLTGAFVAIWLAVTLAYASALLMSGALQDPGAGRFAAATAVLRADPSVHVAADEAYDAVPGPRLDAHLADRLGAVDGVARAVGDRSFPVGADGVDPGRGRRLRGHGWSSAALTPYALRAGHAPHAAGQVVADARLGLRLGDRLRVTAPGRDATVRVSGLADPHAARTGSERALFFADRSAAALSGTPGRVDAVAVTAQRGVAPDALVRRLRVAAGAHVDVLDRAHAAVADAGDERTERRDAMVAVFGTMGGLAGVVALFVVAGTFGLTMAQRRRELAVLRALGATPRQVRRLVSAEALLVSLVAGALGIAAGAPLAALLTRALAGHGTVPVGFEPGGGWIALVASLGLGIVVAQLAVVAAARRAGRTRPAEALNDVAVEHARPGAARILAGVLALGGGAAMALVFDGVMAQAFSVLTGMLLAGGVGLLGRWLLGVPAALLAWPLRWMGPAGLLAGTGLAANRWRTAGLATPIVLIAMLAGTWGLVQSSAQRHAEDVTTQRVTADRVVLGADGAPLPAGTAGEVARLPGVDATAATLPTQVYGLRNRLSEQSPWDAAAIEVSGRAARVLDLGLTDGSMREVRGRDVAVSRVVADVGHLRVGARLRAALGDGRSVTLRVAAIYERGAGLGEVLLDPALVRGHRAAPDAVFVRGGGAALREYAAQHPGVRVVTRAGFGEAVHASASGDASAVWLIIGLMVVFSTLALLNTAAMTTAERRPELATLRLIGGTSGHALRMVVLEMVPTVLTALVAGGVVVAGAVAGVPRGATGVPLDLPLQVAAGLVGGAALLGVLAALVSARLALRTSAAEAMRV